MLNFVRNGFRKHIEIVLWFNLIAWAIGGSALSKDGGIGDSIFGFIVGAVIGIDIVLGGFIATILNMDKNLEILCKKQVFKGC